MLLFVFLSKVVQFSGSGKAVGFGEGVCEFGEGAVEAIGDIFFWVFIHGLINLC